jgi:DNA-binding SARP family transcriptional activator/thioredoxin-like negative regulator of GroEL
LEHAWALEPWGRYVERRAALDALERLIAVGDVGPAPPGRDWRLELLAERAIDVGREFDVEQALALSEEVRHAADPAHQIALARAMLALGQALAWVGTDVATRQAHRAFAEAADRFGALAERDWQGSALLRRGYSAAYQHGDVTEAADLIREAVAAYPPDSMRLAGALGSFADVLIELGEFGEAEAVLDRAAMIAERDGVAKALTDLTWARAHLAAGRGDARATERLLREAEREAVAQDWFQTHIGRSFLLDAAELLDLVGMTDQARDYFERGCAHVGPDNGDVQQTAAVLRARSGDPGLALTELQEIVRRDWLEKRLTWRHTLLTGWATFRAGREGAGELAARAFEQALSCGSINIAKAGEPHITAALAPLAQAADSVPAREILLDGRLLIVRLFGMPSFTAADGSGIELPQGLPGQLVRWLALHEHGLPVDVVLEELFPETSASVARQRLRQVLNRLRTSAGDLVVRDGETLRLIPAWVDVREFLSAANRVRTATGARAMQLAYAALALHTGPLLLFDPYAAWADDIRDQVRYRHLALLDLVAAAAVARGSHQEALTALEAAAELDPDAEERRAAMAAEVRALNRRGLGD